MEAHLTHVLNGIARSMAPTDLKKALSFEALRLASQERVQQRLPQELRAADGGSIEGSAEDCVSRGIQQRTVEQILGLLVATVAKTVGEARPLGVAQYSTTTESEVELSGEAGLSRSGADVTTSACVTTVAKTVGEPQPPGIAKNSTTTEASSGEAGPVGQEHMALTPPPLQQPLGRLEKLSLLESQ